MDAFLVGSAFVMGAVGQVHCATMCAGMATVTCGGPSGGPRRVAVVHAGRIGAYALQGAAFAALGAWVARAAPIHDAQLAVRVIAGLVLVAAGLQLTGVVSPFGWLERWSASPLHRVRAWLGGARSDSAGGQLLRGVAWGVLPCGLVQGALALALAAGRPATGAALMVAFGIGTLPVLLVIARLARRLLAMTSSPRIRRAAGAFVMLSGTAQLGLAAIDAGVVPVGHEVRPCCAQRQAAMP